MHAATIGSRLKSGNVECMYEAKGSSTEARVLPLYSEMSSVIRDQSRSGQPHVSMPAQDRRIRTIHLCNDVVPAQLFPGIGKHSIKFQRCCFESMS